jgi:predicted transposase YbfD/YdcC
MSRSRRRAAAGILGVRPRRSPEERPYGPLAAAHLRTHFGALPDPRVERAKRHDLLDIVGLSLCAVLCGADTWVDVERFGRAKLDWLRTFLGLSNGIPSHDTFGRVFAALDPAAFETAFLGWVRDLVTATQGQVIAIDGKTLRRSHDRPNGGGPLHLVSAWAETNRLVVGQVAVDGKSNEITAIPALLEVLALAGCIVTIDAMGCQTAIANQIVAGGADYVLALKDNQPTLHRGVATYFAEVDDRDPAPARTGRMVEKNHGRLETRACVASADSALLRWLDPTGAWTGLHSVAMVTAERRTDGTVSRETRYFLSSLPPDAALLARAVREHWGIENRLHWVLDLAFREDESRVRSGHAAENLAVLRHLALNLLRRESTARVGVKAKRLMCGWDGAYLLKVLAG